MIKLRFFAGEACWKLKLTNISYNHEYVDDPFELDEHESRDPDLIAAKLEAETMKLTNQPFSAAKRMLGIRGLRLEKS